MRIVMVKSVFTTFMITTSGLLLVGKLFFSSLFGMLGYAAIPLDQLHKLKASTQIVDKLKANHKTKKNRVTKKFAKRTGKKVGATAVSAATIGTVAVVGTLTYIELNEYCEEKGELLKEENILFNKSDVFNFSQCMEEAKQDSTQIAEEAWSMVKKSGSEVLDEIDNFFEPSRRELTEIFDKIDKYFAN